MKIGFRIYLIFQRWRFWKKYMAVSRLFPYPKSPVCIFKNCPKPNIFIGKITRIAPNPMFSYGKCKQGARTLFYHMKTNEKPPYGFWASCSKPCRLTGIMSILGGSNEDINKDISGFSFVSLPEKTLFAHLKNCPTPYLFIGKNTRIATNPIFS